jgi:lipopolysaccharide export system protein LptA
MYKVFMTFISSRDGASRLLPVLAAAFFLVSSWTCFALPEDREQPIEIDADRAISNDKTGVTQFIGNVVLSQGSLIIQADRIVVNQTEREVSAIIAEGKPAKFQQQPEADKGIVTAVAEKIEYKVTDEVVNLIDNAVIDQQGSTIASDLIRYEIAESAAVAEGEDRVNIVIPPKNFKAQDE